MTRLPAAVSAVLARFGGVAAAAPMTGGYVAAAWRVRLDDGAEVMVKHAPYPAEIEAEGLAALAAAGAPTPAVLEASGDVLVLEHVRGTPDWEGLGVALAAVHRRTGASFGWHRDNRIGSLVQPNAELADWPTFYAERRVRPHLAAPALPASVRTRIEHALDGPMPELLGTQPPASLVHGDLWSGNVVDGRWLIDPAVHHADREYDLAFAEVFGGFPPAFWQAYTTAWPLRDGWRARRPALQLSHLLVHVRLFGAGYVGAVVARLDALGW